MEENSIVESNEYSILVGIDTLFDTYMSSIIKVDEDLAVLAIESGYLTRTTNDLSILSKSLSNSKIQEVYKNRTNEILKGSMMTSILGYLHAYTKTTSKAATIEFENGLSITITLNLYPYKLSFEEKKELCTVVLENTEVKDVLVTSISPELLSPRRLVKNYDRVFMYDFDEWLGYNLEKLKHKPIPTVTFVVPFNKVSGKADSVKLEYVENISRKVFARHLDLELLPLGDFSLFLEE